VFPRYPVPTWLARLLKLRTSRRVVMALQLLALSVALIVPWPLYWAAQAANRPLVLLWMGMMVAAMLLAMVVG